jgi:hypothetical protein
MNKNNDDAAALTVKWQRFLSEELPAVTSSSYYDVQ